MVPVTRILADGRDAAVGLPQARQRSGHTPLVGRRREGQAVWLCQPKDAHWRRPLRAPQVTRCWATADRQSEPGLPPLSGGMVGFFAHDMVMAGTIAERAVTPLAGHAAAGHRWAAVDHHEGTITLIANAVTGTAPTMGRIALTTTRSLGWTCDDRSARPTTTVNRGHSFSRPEPRHRAQRTVEEYGAIVVFGGSDCKQKRSQVVPPPRSASRWTPMSIPSTCTEFWW